MANRILKSVLLGAIAAVIGAPLFGAPPAAPATYVLSAASWGPAQDALVAKAGGTLTFRHAGSGLAVAESSSTTFVSDVQRDGTIRAALDQVVQWVPPTQTFELPEDAVTPGDETFVNLQWNIKAVHAPEAWAATGFTGLGVRVAVVDGGLYNSHIDLNGHVDVAHSASFVPPFAFNEDVGTFWHATHVAGIIAALDNGIGTIGIAPDATIVGVKVLHNGSGSFAAVIQGILYSADSIADGGAGADIINMSLGALFPRGGGNTGAGLLVAAMASAVNYATAHNVLVVSAAGNDAVDLDHSGSFISVPAESGSGLAIAATGPVGYAVGYPNGNQDFSTPASYTNFGRSAIWVAAPGGNDELPGNAVCSIPRVPSGSVTTACFVFDFVISPGRGSGASISTYFFAEGTSMAAPAAAGVAALVKQRFPGISVGDLKTYLAKTADLKGPFLGHGFVNALRAVTE